MNIKEVDSLIKLLDDEDNDIYEHVKQKLISLGKDAYEYLNEKSLRAENELQHKRLTEVVSKIHLQEVKSKFATWLQEGAIDLLNGFYLVSYYKYPNLELEPINQYLDKIKLDIWLRLNHKFSPIDNVKVINDVFFGKYRFQGDENNFFSPDNSYLNRVISNRKGNPISLSILYSIIAQKLYLPILGVNLPQHFILAYKDDSFLENDDKFNNSGFIPYNIEGEIIFYINPFNNGAVFSKFNIDRYLKQSKQIIEPYYYEPCSNKEIILRVLRNLIYAYNKKGESLHENNLKEVYSFIKNYVI